jgi:hypothetical protein
MKKYYQITLGLLEKLSKGDQVMKVFGKDTTKKNHFCRVLLLYLKKKIPGCCSKEEKKRPFFQ